MSPHRSNLMAKVCKKYIQEFKLEMIKQVEEQGHKITDVVSHYGIDESTLKIGCIVIAVK